MSNYLIRYSAVQHTTDIYKDYLESGLFLNDLPISKEGIKLMGNSLENPNLRSIEVIYTAPSKKSLMTAEFYSKKLKAKYKILPELDNIKHDFSSLITEEDFKQDDNEYAMKNLRYNFIKQFYDDKLVQSKEDIITKLQIIENNLNKSHNTLFISHGITIKLFYLYSKTKFKVSIDDLLKLAEVNKPFYSPLSGINYPELSDINFAKIN